MLKETTTQVEAPTTTVIESVQDIVVEGGQRVSSLHNKNKNCINYHITVNPILSIMLNEDH